MVNIQKVLLVAGFSLISQLSLAQPLTQHPEMDRPLAVKWEWALAQAGTGADNTRWIAYQFSTELDATINPFVHSRVGMFSSSQRRLGGHWPWYLQQQVTHARPRSLSPAALLAGNTRHAQELPRRLELVLIARLQGNTWHEIRLLDPHTSINWQGLPVYWLGQVSSGESLRLLTGELNPQLDDLLSAGMLHTIGLHNDPDRAGLLFSLLNTADWLPQRPAILHSLSLQKSADIELLLLDVAQDQNAPLTERRVAIAALHRFDSSVVLAALSSLAAPLNPRAIREAAISALTHFDAPEVSQTLHDIIWTESDLSLSNEALTSLSRLRTTQSNSLLLEIAREHPAEKIRDKALQALQRALL